MYWSRNISKTSLTLAMVYVCATNVFGFQRYIQFDAHNVRLVSVVEIYSQKKGEWRSKMLKSIVIWLLFQQDYTLDKEKNQRSQS